MINYQVMAVRIYNSLTHEKEAFTPVTEGRVRLYVCGVTAYSDSHIGHARSAIVFDVISRYLRASGYDVVYVRNFTDIDDKIINRANAEKRSWKEIADTYIASFGADMAALGVLPPTHEPRATEHIGDMIALIEDLVGKGFAYPADGSVYFSVHKDKGYGALSGRMPDEMMAGARIEVDERKKDPLDFALWKGAKPGEPRWESPWGPGRPGWHIECSAMSMKYLGDTLDIHTGGVDLAFPHHENEIAQSEAATGKPFVRTWLHAEHLIIEGQKMSKSLGNFYTLRDLFAKGHKPSTIRFLLLSVPYRRQLNFTEDGLTQARNSTERLRNFVLRLKTAQFAAGSSEEIVKRIEKAENDFDAALADDINTAAALASVFDLVRDVNTAMDRGAFLQQDAPRAIAAMEKFDNVLAVLVDDDDEKLLKLGFGASKQRISSEQVEALIEERNAAKKRRDFKRSDEIRQKLTDSGILVEDTKDGSVRWKYK